MGYFFNSIRASSIHEYSSIFQAFILSKMMGHLARSLQNRGAVEDTFHIHNVAASTVFILIIIATEVLKHYYEMNSRNERGIIERHSASNIRGPPRGGGASSSRHRPGSSANIDHSSSGRGESPSTHRRRRGTSSRHRVEGSSLCKLCNLIIDCKIWQP